MVLRGIFLARQQDIDWFYQQGASRLFPDIWEQYLAPIAASERQHMVKAYYRELTSENPQTREAAARAWSGWEGMTATLLPNPQVVNHFTELQAALSIARIECHYFVNQSFLDANQLLNNAHRLRGIPGHIIHGRYDVICPLEQAWELHRAWPEAQLRIIADAGHAVVEPGITTALLDATDEMGTLSR
jgi:proline iminopeptidase